MAEPIISVSGLRGIVGETLTPEVAVRYAAAFAAIAPPGAILIGRDGRPSGHMLAEAIQPACRPWAATRRCRRRWPRPPPACWSGTPAAGGHPDHRQP